MQYSIVDYSHPTVYYIHKTNLFSNQKCAPFDPLHLFPQSVSTPPLATTILSSVSMSFVLFFEVFSLKEFLVFHPKGFRWPLLKLPMSSFPLMILFTLFTSFYSFYCSSYPSIKGIKSLVKNQVSIRLRESEALI